MPFQLVSAWNSLDFNREYVMRWLALIVTMFCMVLCGLNLPGWCYAQPVKANEDELRSQVRQHLADLDSNQRARRQAAEKQLLDLGPRILKLLPAPELLPNAGVRAAVLRVRVALERRQALESVQASRVNTAADLKLEDWLKQVEDQTGNQIGVAALTRENKKPVVTQPCENLPFWVAMEKTLQNTGLRYRFEADSSLLKLVPQTDPAADAAWQATSSGPFRVAVDWVRPRKVVGNDRLQRLRTELSVAPEPRLRALFLKLSAKDFQATGPRGQTFPAADTAAQYDLPLGEGGRFVTWNLDFTADGSLTQADIFPLKIAGQAAMQIAADSEHIRFTDLVGGAGTARRRGGVTVTVQKIKSQTGADGKLAVSIKVLVVYDTGGPAFESHRTWIFHNEVYLDRHDQQPILANGGFETDLQQNRAVGVTYRFEGLSGKLEDYQFVYVAPTLIVDVPFKIELNGVHPPEKK